MNSEKVKEIKKALDCCKNSKCVACPYNEGECEIELRDNVEDYINELESENERLSKELDSEWKDRRKAEEDLHKAQWNYKIGLGQSRKRNKELKDRIAELEKENVEILERGDYQKGYDEAVKMMKDTAYDCVKEAELKQFAERLKEKLEESNFINNGLWLVDTQVLIDETLKECINE